MNKMPFPKGETVWVCYCGADGALKFIVTTKAGNRDYYFLYEWKNEKFVKLGKSRSPVDLEERYKVPEKLREGQSQ